MAVTQTQRQTQRRPSVPTRRLPPSTGPTFPSGASGPNVQGSYIPSFTIPGITNPPATYPNQVDVNVNTSQRNQLLNSLMSPEALAALGIGGLGLAQGLLSNKANAAEGQRDREARRRELLSLMYGDELDDMRSRQQSYLASTQMDPVSQARDLFSANLLRDVAGRGAPQITPGAGVSNPLTVSNETMGFLSPTALAENAGRFYSAAGQVNPDAMRPDLGAMGFGDAGRARQGAVDDSINQAARRYAELNQSRRDALLDSVGGGGPGGVGGPGQHTLPGSGHMVAPPKQGGGFWRGLGRIAGMVAPFAMMAVPGLQGAGMASMLGRAGASAGIGALTGGRRGAAYSGGSSLANDYFNRRIGR